MRLATLLVILSVSPAVADDPAPTPGPVPPPAALSAFLIADVPTLPPASMRIEAVRVINENWENSWRYPQPGPMLGIEGGLWYMGDGFYRPRTARSAALHGASIGATLVGEILMGSGSPLAGVGALLTGATLDAAAADVDRDHESRRRR